MISLIVQPVQLSVTGMETDIDVFITMVTADPLCCGKLIFSVLCIGFLPFKWTVLSDYFYCAVLEGFTGIHTLLFMMVEGLYSAVYDSRRPMHCCL